ncbi:uncharacterized protein LOC107769629 [Nicotiana tabacum]|uniref:Uncharacterized protein LOC107769629 n=1 Tax=Nicotiana tabacum TaxID=4097 RepID=A0AC58RVK4_TOBAC
MNTDITASAKPEYPVIDRNPPFTKTVANFNTLDYLRLTTIAGISVTVGYLSGIKPGIRGPSMVTGGLIGVMGGFMYAYQNSAGRLMGFFPNEGEWKGKDEKPKANGSETECYRCGGKWHWANICRVPRHLVELYQASLKNKDPEANFVSDNDFDITHLDVADFFERPEGKIDYLIGDGSVVKED